jgi:mannose-1-phosphate guanylyltransferase
VDFFAIHATVSQVVVASSSRAIDAAMVLAAGFGTRLRPLTEELPKALVPLGDRSVLEHILAAIRRAGIERIVVNAHHLAGRFDAASLGVTLVVEEHILGTAGGVAGAADGLGGGDVLVYNGDILADVDVSALRAAHGQAIPFSTLALAERLAPGVGTVGVGPRGDVVRLRTGRFGEEVWSADFVGVQILSPAAREALPEEGCLVGDVYLPALEHGERIIGTCAARGFVDVGTPARYHAANMRWLESSGQSTLCGAGGRVAAGVALSHSIVGEAAVIEGTGKVERCVIWPGAAARAPLADAIVLTSGRVVRPLLDP